MARTYYTLHFKHRRLPLLPMRMWRSRVCLFNLTLPELTEITASESRRGSTDFYSLRQSNRYPDEEIRDAAIRLDCVAITPESLKD